LTLTRHHTHPSTSAVGGEDKRHERKAAGNQWLTSDKFGASGTDFFRKRERSGRAIFPTLRPNAQSKAREIFIACLQHEPTQIRRVEIGPSETVEKRISTHAMR
jgi:hypothetical protein